MDSGFEIKYRKLLRTYYANLLFYAKRIVGDDDAEDVVQDVFVELWHRKKTWKRNLKEQGSPKSKAMRFQWNKSMN